MFVLVTLAAQTFATNYCASLRALYVIKKVIWYSLRCNMHCTGTSREEFETKITFCCLYVDIPHLSSVLCYAPDL